MVLRPFAPPALPGFLATTASADFSSTLMEEISPGKVQNLSPRADWLYLMRLDDLWASLFRASLPPAPGLTARSCSYGREFATRFLQLHLAATPCASLRLPSSAPVGSFHPTRFCPCWAHSAAGWQPAHISNSSSLATAVHQQQQFISNGSSLATAVH